MVKKVVLRFPRHLVDKAIVYRLVKDYNLEFNILKASVTPKEEGLLVLELSGEPKEYEKGVRYLTDMGVDIQPLSRDIVRNEERCTHCGACIAICPTQALEIDPQSRRVNFIPDRCIACELCVLPCPPRAMEVRF